MAKRPRSTFDATGADGYVARMREAQADEDMSAWERDPDVRSERAAELEAILELRLGEFNRLFALSRKNADATRAWVEGPADLTKASPTRVKRIREQMARIVAKDGLSAAREWAKEEALKRRRVLLDKVDRTAAALKRGNTVLTKFNALYAGELNTLRDATRAAGSMRSGSQWLEDDSMLSESLEKVREKLRREWSSDAIDEDKEYMQEFVAYRAVIRETEDWARRRHILGARQTARRDAALVGAMGAGMPADVLDNIRRMAGMPLPSRR